MAVEIHSSREKDMSAALPITQVNNMDNDKEFIGAI